MDGMTSAVSRLDFFLEFLVKTVIWDAVSSLGKFCLIYCTVLPLEIVSVITICSLASDLESISGLGVTKILRFNQ
jgi:hypothetical protein